MEKYYADECVTLYHGTMQEVLDSLPAESVDSIVTDPPYELGFMGKGWDSSGVAFQRETWEKCLRVLKPGGYLLAFGGSRTMHRIACAIEDAGFEIRDNLMWLYGCGFPKSMNIGKSIEARMMLGSGNISRIKDLDGEKTEAQGGLMGMDLMTGNCKREYEKVRNDVEFHTEEGRRWSVGVPA